MSSPQPSGIDAAPVTLLDLAIVVLKHKKQVLGLTLAVAVLTTVVLLLLPNKYAATARMLPPQQNQNAAAAAFGALANLAGGAGSMIAPALGLKNPNDLYVGILKGPTIADRIIERFDLQSYFGTDTLVETRRELSDIVIIEAGRDGLISIQVEHTNPSVAADMANAYIDELSRLTQQLAVTDASQRRLFFERELVAAKAQLADAEVALRTTQEKTGLIQPEGQAKAIFEAVAELSARIAAKEVELAAIRTFATDKNPDYLRGKQELESLKTQLTKLERWQPQAAATPNVLVPTSRVPEAGIEYLRRFRDLKHHETVYELLTKQYELAKIEEAKDAPLIQVVDKATAPDRKSKPRRTLILLISIVVALVVGILWAVIREMVEQLERDADGAKKLKLLRAYLRLRGV